MTKKQKLIVPFILAAAVLFSACGIEVETGEVPSTTTSSEAPASETTAEG